ncbi:MAG: pyruvate kinase [Bacteroidales bacterium]
MQKLTKIVATISDRHCEPEFLSSLHRSGMDVVRINTAHQNPDQSLRIMENVRKVSSKIPVMVDTKGPEIRTNSSDKDIEVKAGELIRMAGDSSRNSDPECIRVNYPGFVKQLDTGRQIMIDDGDVALTVQEKHSGHLLCRVENSGVIKARKSVNLPGSNIDLPTLSDKDRKYIDFAISNDVAFIAHSFVRSKEDVMTIQEILDAGNSQVKIIAKIENQQGVDNIDEILDHVHGIMIARGDLAIEVPAERIPGIQHNLIQKCIRQKKLVIVATQMLHTMIDNPRPTRAEVSDIATAVFSGTDAVMLSGETAYGKYPLESVQMMTNSLREAENSRSFSPDSEVMPHDNQVSVFLSKTVVRSVQQLNTRAVITDTDTGKTARYLSAFRGRTPIYAQCYVERVMRELALNYGVLADYMDVEISKKEFIKVTLSRLIDKKEIGHEDLVAVLAGNFGKKAGPSFVEISTASNMLTNHKS